MGLHFTIVPMFLSTLVIVKIKYKNIWASLIDHDLYLWDKNIDTLYACIFHTYECKILGCKMSSRTFRIGKKSNGKWVIETWTKGQHPNGQLLYIFINTWKRSFTFCRLTSKHYIDVTEASIPKVKTFLFVRNSP